MNDAVYCGPAPAPETLIAAWNLDPALLAGLGLAAWLAAYRGGAAAWAGWAALVVALVSPLCALSAALFAARAAHHVVLVAVAAPLIALASLRVARASLGPVAAFTAHAAILWFWHAPAAYAWALDSHAAYWLMQASLLASAVALWRAAFLASVGEALTVLLGTTAHMGLLGALLLFAPHPLYAAHLLTTEAWGLSALRDQQLAGLIMWVLAGAPYLGVAAVIAWRAASPDGRRLA